MDTSHPHTPDKSQEFLGLDAQEAKNGQDVRDLSATLEHFSLKSLEPAASTAVKRPADKDQFIFLSPEQEAVARELVELRFPHMSAKYIFSKRMANLISLAVIVGFFFFGFHAGLTALAIFTVIHLIYVAHFVFKVVLQMSGAFHSNEAIDWAKEISQLSYQDLPVYTILLPLFKEANMLKAIIAGIEKLDYPKEKLDVKMLLEESDPESVEKALKMALPPYVQVIVTPKSSLQTKPKAMNAALPYVRGEFLTIYDGEDQPEVDQLKKAVAYFRKYASPLTFCLQGQLNFFNRNENLLTRFFTLDYSAWFDFFIPGLAFYKVIIPLGGTSNHFRVDLLREALGGWDAYNVTEDADLSVRAARLGYTVDFLPSTTWEEATVHWMAWVKQRTRWLKGYMVTYFVHMRNPIRLWKEIGNRSFWFFQLFYGLSWMFLLVNPLLHGHFVYWVITGKGFYWDYFWWPSVMSLLLGNGFLIYMSALSSFKRGFYSLSLVALLIPFYWFMMSVAAWRALWHLIAYPHKWEKTPHGLSKVSVGS
jgi:cellulose synthase/poly-beta-1,6-N-acetylglucosamine synthase-like glycosyltransferase